MHCRTANKERQVDQEHHKLGSILIQSVILFERINLLGQLEVFSEFAPAVISITNSLLKMILDQVQPVVLRHDRIIFSIQSVEKLPIWLLLSHSILQFLFLKTPLL